MELLHKNFLSKELLKWRDEGLVSDDFVLTISSRYGLKLHSSQNSMLIILAYLFFGLSLMVLVGANWQEIPEVIKISLLFVLTSILNLGGYIKYKKEEFKFSTALFLLSSISFCCSVVLISQIYHLDKYLPNGILFCSVAVLVLGVVFKDAIITAFSLMIATAWVVGNGFYTHTINPLFLIFLVIGFYIFRQRDSVFLSFVLFVDFFIYILFVGTRVDTFFINESSIVVLTFTIISYSLFIGSLKDFFVYIKKEKIAYEFYKIYIFFTLFWFLAGALYYTMAYAYIHFRYEDLFYTRAGVIFFIFCVISFVMAFKFKNISIMIMSAFVLLFPFLHLQNIDLAWLFYFASLLFGVSLIKEGFIRAGLFMIFTTALIVYLNLIGDYIGASVLFLIFAVIMLVVARKRLAK